MAKSLDDLIYISEDGPLRIGEAIREMIKNEIKSNLRLYMCKSESFGDTKIKYTITYGDAVVMEDYYYD
jgi:hypothetical protein